MTEAAQTVNSRRTWGRLLKQARPYRWHVAAIFGLGLLATPLALLQPVPIKIAIDSVLGSEPLPGWLDAVLPDAWVDTPRSRLVLATLMLIVTALLLRLHTLGHWLLTTWTSQRMVLDFRARLFRHTQRLSLAYHDTKGTADSAYRILYDAPSIQHLAIDGVIPFVTSAFSFTAMLVVMALLSIELALVALAIAPVLVYTSHYYGRTLKQRWKSVKKLDSASMSVIQEALASVRVVKAFGREEREEGRFEDVSHQRNRENLAVAASESVFGILTGVTLAAGTAGVVWFGVGAVQQKTLTVGNLLLVMAYVAQMYEPLRTMSKKFTTVQSSLASAERAFELLDEANEVPEKADARPLARARGAVTFEAMTFSYDGSRPALCDFSLDVEPGSRVGIAGHTGAGKTTLISLLMRFYDPTGGRILLDGVDLRDYLLKDLRAQYAVVLQEPVLFSASIAENIAYARPDATQNEIAAAARAANAHDFIAALEAGYETMVGERGMKLSGGERQRISLARAFLRDAPILILDEPTSSIDSRTEQDILEAMQRLMAGRTTFMIAHRLGTLAGCDVRVELERGRLVPSPALAHQPQHG